MRVGKKSDPVLSRLWTKVHDIFGQSRRPFVLSSALARLSTSCFVQKIFVRPLSVELVEKSFLAPIFSGRTTANVLQRIVSAIYRPPFGKV